MAQAATQELVDRFEEFYRQYYADEVGELARKYPREQKSLTLDWGDVYRFDPDLADDFIRHPDEIREAAKEALRLYDLPVDVKLGKAHVRVKGLGEQTEIRAVRSEHLNTLVSVQGIVRKATDVRPKIQEAVFVCQRCGAETVVPQSEGGFQEPYQCESCERQGPFKLNAERSDFIDAQKLRIQESPEGLDGGETPQSVDIHIEDDITGRVSPGDHITATGILRLDQSESGKESPIFDVYMEGSQIVIEDEQFEEMNITEEDEELIHDISNDPDIYEKMVGSIAPAIYGHDQAKLAMALQLFSGVTKHLPDGSRIRGDLHMLLIGDPGTGKCVSGDTRVPLSDGTERPIRELVESNLVDPKPIDDGVWDDADIDLPTLADDTSMRHGKATRVWKREAPDRMYRIETESGSTVEVTPSHPLFVQQNGRHAAIRADDLHVGQEIFIAPTMIADGGVAIEPGPQTGIRAQTTRIETIERYEPDEEWVYDLEVVDTHNYVTNGVISHNSQLLSYVKNIAPRSVYTSGKGSSSAGLTAAAVRDDFGDGNQWTLEAGALVLADMGIAAVDELDKMECITGDSRVRLGDRTTRIRDFAIEAAAEGEIETLSNGRIIRDIDATAWTMTADGRLETRPVTAVHEYDATDELTRVTLSSGERLTATDDHPFFVMADGERVEKPAAALTPGEWVFVPRAVSEAATDGGVLSADAVAETPEGDSSGVSPSLAAVLGYLAGDGNLYYDRDAGVYGIRFTNKEPELLADFERASAEAFGVEPVRPPSEQRDDGVQVVRVPGKASADRVIDAGMNRETYDGKTLPEAVTASSRTAKAAFIRALADSEGNVDNRTVSLFSASYELLLGTKQLLLEFGISSQIQVRNRTAGRDLYVLCITAARSLERFDRHIGFTLERKQAALTSVLDTVTGDRTIIDVIPDIGPLLEQSRTALRLHQSECGLDDATYCNFENGDANISIRAARTVLGRFEDRRSRANADLESLSQPTWDELSELKSRYHVSQTELADGVPYSQQQISARWGDDSTLKGQLSERFTELLASVASTDLTRLRTLVHGDVKWRRVDSVETVSSAVTDDKIALRTADLAELLECSADECLSVARSIVAAEVSIDSWEDVQEALDRFAISHSELAADIGVNQSTVTRWLNGTTSTDRFPEVAAAVEASIDETVAQVRDILEEIEGRRQPKVYDLTVEGTHNFIANGMVVHNSDDRSAMHEALEQQSYHPTSETLLADGRRVEMGEFVDEAMADNPDAVVDGVDCEILPLDDVRVHSVDLDTNETTKERVDRVSRHEAPDEFVRVAFSNGRSVLVTPEHPMFVDDGEGTETVDARNVEPGSFVPAPRKLPNSSTAVELQEEPHIGKERDVDLPTEIDEDLAEILGFLVAEGHSYAGSSHEIGFSNQDQQLLDRVGELMEQVFGISSTDTTNAAGTVTQRWVSTKLYRWFEENFPEFMHTAREKRIPARVLGASEEHVRRFLVGAFAGDGGVESEAMSFSTASPGLAEDYADALSKIGVASRIHHDTAEDSWKVYVMGDSTERFVDRVVESTDDRYDTAQAFVDRSTNTPRHHDVLPTSAAREIRSLRKTVGLALTGRFRPHIDEAFGVRIETVESEVEAIRERIGEVRRSLEAAPDLSAVRGAVDWSARQLAERLDGVTPGEIYYAENGGYDATTRERLARDAREAVSRALEDASRRIEELADRVSLRYYRVTDVETVPNEGEYETDWVYDVTVEPTNTFVSQGVVLHNSISISKAGINATLKSRCSLLGAANPKYGRFDQYEPIGEQIDLEPALISRFDLIFTVTDKPNQEEDSRLAKHILQTNYAGELNTQRDMQKSSKVSEQQIADETKEVKPDIDSDILRKYIAYSRRNCYPTMTPEARQTIEDFYVDLRARGADEDAPVPVTARQLEAIVRLAEASARVRLSDTVEQEDADRVITIVRDCLADIGIDPETGEFDADIIETGRSKTQRDRVKDILGIVESLEDEFSEGAPIEEVLDTAEEHGTERSKAEHQIENLKQKGELYEPSQGHLRTT